MPITYMWKVANQKCNIFFLFEPIFLQSSAKSFGRSSLLGSTFTGLGFCVPGNLFPLRPENSGNLSEAFVRIIMLKINRKTEKRRCQDQIDQFSDQALLQKFAWLFAWLRFGAQFAQDLGDVGIRGLGLGTWQLIKVQFTKFLKTIQKNPAFKSCFCSKSLEVGLKNNILHLVREKKEENCRSICILEFNAQQV